MSDTNTIRERLLQIIESAVLIFTIYDLLITIYLGIWRFSELVFKVSW